MKRLRRLSLLVAVALMLSSCTVIAPAIEKALTPAVPEEGTIKIFGPAVVSSAPEGRPIEEKQTGYPVPEATSQAPLTIADEQLEALGTALVQAGILDMLAKDGPYTILAPSNEAFASLDAAAMETLLGNKDQLEAFLRAHVLHGILTQADLATMESVETLAGATLNISTSEKGLTIGGARILEGDLYVPNAIVHIIDRLLYAFPPVQDIVDLTEQEAVLSTWAALLKDQGIDQWLRTVGPFTLLAPTDQALARFREENPDIFQDPVRLAAVVQYHIIPEAIEFSEGMPSRTVETWLGPAVTFTAEGNRYRIEEADVLLANLQASNGVVHLIDAVLIPPETATPTPDLIAWLRANPELGAIVEWLSETTLPEELANLEAFTLFLPSNAALAAVPTETIAALASDPETLANVLRYHIVPVALLSTDLVPLTQTLTLAGIPVVIQAEPLSINGVPITRPDIRVGHGIVHIIDGILMPPETWPLVTEEAEEEAAPTPEPTPTETPSQPMPEGTPAPPLLAQRIRLTTAIKAIVASGLLGELEETGPVTIFAPIDRAFDRFSPAELETWLADPSQVAEMLRQHIVAGTLTIQDLAPGTLQTLAGTEVEVAIDPTTRMMTIGGAHLLWGDMRLGDTVIHIIDDLLLRQEALAKPSLQETGSTVLLVQALRQEPRAGTMRALLEITDLSERLTGEEPLTLLIPTDEAFQAVPKSLMRSLLKQENLREVLLHHIISGTLSLEALEDGTVTPLSGEELVLSIDDGEWRIGQATIIDRIEAANGRIYLVDRLLLPASFPLDVMGRLYVTEGLGEWLDLLEQAQLEETLGQYEYVTLLAPTDEALAELTEAERAAITANKEALARWVGRHIIPRRMTAAQLAGRRSVETLFGEEITIRSRRGNLFFGGAKVVERNIAATNGLIHIIDTAVVP